MYLAHTKSTLIATSIANLGPSGRAVLWSLEVSNYQEDIGGTFDASVCEWEKADAVTILGLACLLGDDPVGIVLLKRPPSSPSWVQDGAVSLYGLKIAEDYQGQGQGLGRIAFGLAFDAAEAHWPMASKLVLPGTNQRLQCIEAMG